MALNATVSVNPTVTTPGQPASVTLTLLNPGTAALTVTQVQPFVVGNATASLNMGLPALSQGQNLTVPAGGLQALNLAWGVVGNAPSFIPTQSPGAVAEGSGPLTEVPSANYSIGANVTTSDGVISSALASTLNVVALPTSVPTPPLNGQMRFDSSFDSALIVVGSTF